MVIFGQNCDFWSRLFCLYFGKLSFGSGGLSVGSGSLLWVPGGYLLVLGGYLGGWINQVGGEDR